MWLNIQNQRWQWREDRMSQGTSRVCRASKSCRIMLSYSNAIQLAIAAFSLTEISAKVDMVFSNFIHLLTTYSMLSGNLA